MTQSRIPYSPFRIFALHRMPPTSTGTLAQGHRLLAPSKVRDGLLVLGLAWLLLAAAMPANGQSSGNSTSTGSNGPEPATVYGQVSDENGRPISEANVVVLGQSGVGVTTDDEGRYSVAVELSPEGEAITLAFTHVSYEVHYRRFAVQPGRFYRYDPALVERTLQTITIEDERERQEFIQAIPIESIEYVPNPAGDPIIAALKQLGAASNNELSSQYSVRGGNYDENLVYVNDFEIYRPLVVRSGQQEGFPFPNYQLTERVAFSAGGFEARYGDKLSSVLDITYKKPRDFDASLALSLLGGQAHVEVGNGENLGFLLGIRHRDNSYLLNSQNTSGQYRPSFTDVQALINWEASETWEFEVLGNLSRNQFRFIPESRSTSTGLVNEVIRLDVFFEGQERTGYLTGMGGISATHRPRKELQLKWLASTYRALEDEQFDIIGDYFLGEVEESLGEDDFGQVAFGIGTGSFQNYARNRIDSWVSNLSFKGFLDGKRHFWEWGARYQHEFIEDWINDWTRIDSAGYSVPQNGEDVQLDLVLKGNNRVRSNRYEAYLQDTWTPDSSQVNWNLSYGVRLNYWDLNQELVVSPRVQTSFKPNWTRPDSTERDVVFKLAAGMYAQPAFYRELRDLDFNVNTNVRAQKSVHLVAGGDWRFQAFGDREFSFAAEAYYKYLWDIVPYEIQNVQVRYYGANAARGYVAGLDLRLNGELVEGADSWVSLSILQTEEDLDELALSSIFGALDEDGNPIDRGNMPRPTDQRVNVGMFFQDYLPGNQNFKVHLNFLFGTGLPFGQPRNLLLRNRFRIPPYRRVDIGFSALLLDGKKDRTGFFGEFESIWASVEVFNLLGINNTVSYFWVRDNDQLVYAFPNFLTARLVNARLIVKI